MSMRTFLKVSGVILVAVMFVYFVIQTPQSESSQSEAGPPIATDVELANAAPEIPSADLVQRSTIDEDFAGAMPSLAGNKLLRVILEGISEEDAKMTRVTVTGVKEGEEWLAEIQDSWLCTGLTSEFNLASFFASVAQRDENLHLEELEIKVDHPLHLIETTRVSLTQAVDRDSGETVYEVRVRLVPVAVIHGRLTRANGASATQGLVGVLLLQGGFPIEEEGHAVECAADGEFEIRIPASGLYALAAYEGGRRPTTTHVEVLVGTRIDVGNLVLESGHTISGQVLRQGKPLAGASISATPPKRITSADPAAVASGMYATVYEGRTFVTSVRSVHFHWLPTGFATHKATHEAGTGSRQNGRFELAGQEVSTDKNGAFAFEGLGTGEYLLRMEELAEAHDSVPGYWDNSEREDMHRINGGKPALVVTAPETGVEFAFHWTSIRFELAGDLEDEDEGRLVLRTKSGSTAEMRAMAPQKNLSIAPEYFSTQFPLSGNEAAFILQVPPKRHLLGEVVFPGRQPVALDFWTPEPGGEIVVPIELVRAENLATLVIELENPRAEIPDAFTVMLWRMGQEDYPSEKRLVEVSKGQLRVEGILPGTYRVQVRAGEDKNYSAGLFHVHEFDFELHPDQVASQSILMGQGAGLHVTVRGDDGELLTGEYEFFDAIGNPVDLTLQAGGWISSWKIYPHGTHESRNELHPGRYRLLLRSPGYANQSVIVELRAGEYEEVDVTLAR